MTDLDRRTNEFQWLLSNFVDETGGALEAIAVSSDGFLLGSSGRAAQSAVDQLCAMVAGLNSLSRGVADFLDFVRTERVVIEMTGGLLLTASMGDGSLIAIVTGPDADLGSVGYEMARLVERAGAAMTPDLIAHMKNALTV